MQIANTSGINPLERVEWWIVEVADYGRTAMPSLNLAQNGASVLRDGRQRVTKVRKARMTEIGDLLAIEAALREIQENALKTAIEVSRK